MGEDVEKLVEIADHLGSTGYSHGKWVTHARVARQTAATLERVTGELASAKVTCANVLARAEAAEQQVEAISGMYRAAEAQVDVMRKALEDRGGVVKLLRNMSDEIWCVHSPTRPRLRAMAALLEDAAIAPESKSRGVEGGVDTPKAEESSQQPDGRTLHIAYRRATGHTDTPAGLALFDRLSIKDQAFWDEVSSQLAAITAPTEARSEQAEGEA